jgi:predicted  nucleic acid-binding Zn-ribbon protein
MAMSDRQDGEVLDYLREQFARVHVRFDRLDADVLNLKVRMSAVEVELGHLRIGIGEVNGRIDRIESRLGRIERRLDLVDDAP